MIELFKIYNITILTHEGVNIEEFFQYFEKVKGVLQVNKDN